MLPVEWKRAAYADLWAIVDYISDDNPKAAQELKDELVATVDNPKSANVPGGACSRHKGNRSQKKLYCRVLRNPKPDNNFADFTCRSRISIAVLMKNQSTIPDTLYKYLSVSRTHDFLKKPGVSLSSVCLFEDKREGICQSHLPDEQAERMLRAFYENSRYGILCLCENSTNFKMWAKYAEDHCGIMVGFDPTHPFFKQDPLEPWWNKVNYTDNVPTLPECPVQNLASPSQDYKKRVFEVLREGILRKDEQWRFEAEWRKRGLLAKPATWRGFYFPQGEVRSIVRSVCMGANISKADKSLCEAFCQHHQISLYQAMLSGSSVTISAP